MDATLPESSLSRLAVAFSPFVLSSKRNPSSSPWLAFESPTPRRGASTLRQTLPAAQTIHMGNAARYSDCSQWESIDNSGDPMPLRAQETMVLNI